MESEKSPPRDPSSLGLVCANAAQLRADIAADLEFAHITVEQRKRQFQTADTPEDLGFTLLYIFICAPPPYTDYDGMLRAARACFRAIYSRHIGD